MAKWIRQEQPKVRRIVLTYKTDAQEYQEIEEVMQLIPYGEGNKTLLEYLKAGIAYYDEKRSINAASQNKGGE